MLFRSDVYGMDKDRNHLFAHFCGSPKPWVAWTPNAFRFFDAGCRIVQWAQDQRLRLPGPVPFSLRPGHKAICKLLARPIELKTKVQNRLRRLCRSR